MATQNLHVLSSFLAKTSGNAQGLEKHAFLERLVHLLQYNLAFGWVWWQMEKARVTEVSHQCTYFVPNGGR